MKNNGEKGLVKCFGCGELVSESQSYTVFNKETEENETVCEHCRKYGVKGYVACNGCGGSNYPCWVKSDEVFDTVCTDYNLDSLVCREFLGNYNYCEDCDKYYYDLYDNCPICNSESI